MAASPAKDSAARDDGTAHHTAAAGLSENCARCFHVVAGWQATLANGNSEVPETFRASTTSASAASQARTRRRQSRSWSQARSAAPDDGKEKGEGRTAGSVASGAAGCAETREIQAGEVKASETRASKKIGQAKGEKSEGEEEAEVERGRPGDDSSLAWLE